MEREVGIQVNEDGVTWSVSVNTLKGKFDGSTDQAVLIISYLV
jgi:hypothetical protein